MSTKNDKTEDSGMTDKQAKALLSRVDKLEKALGDATTRVAALEKTLAAIKAVFLPRGGGDVEPADDAELDGRYGDPQIRKDPSAKYWSGESYVGCRLSETSTEYLQAFITWKLACAAMSAKDPARAKYADYDRKDAARAKGWILRMKSGVCVPPKREPSRGGFDAGDAGGFGGGSTKSFDTGFDPARSVGGGFGGGDGVFGGETGFESGDAGDDEIPF